MLEMLDSPGSAKTVDSPDGQLADAPAAGARCSRIRGTASTSCHDRGPVTHARLSIYPDGGVARLRLFGTLP